MVVLSLFGWTYRRTVLLFHQVIKDVKRVAGSFMGAITRYYKTEQGSVSNGGTALRSVLNMNTRR